MPTKKKDPGPVSATRNLVLHHPTAPGVPVTIQQGAEVPPEYWPQISDARFVSDPGALGLDEVRFADYPEKGTGDDALQWVYDGPNGERVERAEHALERETRRNGSVRRRLVDALRQFLAAQEAGVEPAPEPEGGD